MCVHKGEYMCVYMHNSIETTLIGFAKCFLLLLCVPHYQSKLPSLNVTGFGKIGLNAASKVF